MLTFSRLLHLSALTFALSVAAVTSSANTSESGSALAGLFAQKPAPKFLPVHQAFNVAATQNGDLLTVSFRVTPEHYIYKDNLRLTLPDGVSMGVWTFDKPHTMIDDPEFGRVAVFEQDVVARVKLTSQTDVTAPLAIRWQGCAKAGLCYPPETTKITISLTGTDNINKKENAQVVKDVTPITNHQSADKPDNGTKNYQQDIDKTEKKVDAQLAQTSNSSLQSGSPQQADSLASVSAMSDALDGRTAEADLSAEQHSDDAVFLNASDDHASKNSVTSTNHQALISQSDPFGINKNPVLAVMLLFLAGLLLSFTPCVYPMIPIVANIVAHSKSHSALKGFALSSSYGLGVASVYGVVGGLIAWFGQAMGVLGLLQNPYVLGVFAIIFALLALYMFGVIKVALPSGVRHFLHQKSQSADKKLGSVSGSFIAGMLSALVVSPCVSAPMAGALTAVSVSGSVPFGFIALFSLGLGLSIPLMFIGLAQGKFMPKAGEWMNRVKEFCGLLLLAVSLSLLERLLFSHIMLIIWAVWFAMTATWLFRMRNLASQAFALVSAFWVACLVLGAAAGASDPWRPLAKFTLSASPTQANSDIKITTLDDLDVLLTKHDKVLVDVTADWCVECRIMEGTLFTNRPAVLNDYQVVKLDVTKTNDDSRAVLSRYELFGPPALLIYKEGQLQIMLLGETKRADFEVALAKF